MILERRGAGDVWKVEFSLLTGEDQREIQTFPTLTSS
jgi:hypothetical protein